MENDVTNPNTNGQKFTGEDQDLEAVEQEDAVDQGEDEIVEEDEASELERVQAERDSYLDQLQRSVAEFANFRRRTEQERAQLASVVRKDVLAQFLPIIDDFERAMEQVPEDEKSNSWVTGLAMIESKFRNVLERSDVQAIDPVGQPFDPSKHEAVATDPGTDGSTVVEVYQKGYSIGDMLVRPAMVKTGDPEKIDA